MAKLLSDKQKKEASELLLNYKRVFSCKKCGVIFGSDLKDESGICPACEKIKENIEVKE